MTTDEKLAKLEVMLGSVCESNTLVVYLDLAKQKVLNKRFPFGTELTEVPSQYENLQLELAVCLFNKRGAEGQETHNENGVNRTWRTEAEILEEIPSMVGMPL